MTTVANDNAIEATRFAILKGNLVPRVKRGVLKGILGALHYSGLGKLLAPLTRGRGIIFTLHSVRPDAASAFDPNGILRVTPAFLESAIEATQQAGYEIVSLDEAERRLRAPRADERPFACFTFDDGYRDNRDYAYPIFARRGLPMAIYVPTDYPEGRGELWWLVLENAIRTATAIDIVLDGTPRRFVTATAAEKAYAYDSIYWALRRLPEAELRAEVRALAERAGYDASRLCADEIMTWDELRALAEDPLVTFGAHTRRHLAVAKLSAEEAMLEIAESVRILESELGRPCRHFSYPYGDAGSAGDRDFAIARALGVATAVTTRKNVVTAGHVDALTGLPRVSLNGDFQHPRYVSIYLTGLPFALLTAGGSLRRRLAGALVAGAARQPAPAESVRSS